MNDDERLALFEITSLAMAEIKQNKSDMEAQRGINAAMLVRIKLLEDAVIRIRGALDMDYDEVDYSPGE